MTKRDHVLIEAADASVREFVDSVLRQAGYSTARALDAPEALGIARQFGPFDLLVTEEVSENHELARQLRQIEPDLKVLYLTGSGESGPVDAVTLGENELLLDKPVTAGALLKDVSILLCGRLPRTDDSRQLTHAPLQSAEKHDCDSEYCSSKTT